MPLGTLAEGQGVRMSGRGHQKKRQQSSKGCNPRRTSPDLDERSTDAVPTANDRDRNGAPPKPGNPAALRERKDRTTPGQWIQMGLLIAAVASAVFLYFYTRASEQSVRVMQASVEQGKAALAAAERPVLNVMRLRLLDAPYRDKHLEIDVKNVGRSPATHIIYGTTAQYRCDTPIALITVVNDQQLGQDLSIGPDTAIWLSSDIVKETEEVGCREGRGPRELYVQGWIYYSDVLHQDELFGYKPKRRPALEPIRKAEDIETYGRPHMVEYCQAFNEKTGRWRLCITGNSFR
jgi:hypothetical protein